MHFAHPDFEDHTASHLQSPHLGCSLQTTAASHFNPLVLSVWIPRVLSTLDLEVGSPCDPDAYSVDPRFFFSPIFEVSLRTAFAGFLEPEGLQLTLPSPSGPPPGTCASLPLSCTLVANKHQLMDQSHEVSACRESKTRRVSTQPPSTPQVWESSLGLLPHCPAATQATMPSQPRPGVCQCSSLVTCLLPPITQQHDAWHKAGPQQTVQMNMGCEDGVRSTRFCKAEMSQIFPPPNSRHAGS